MPRESIKELRQAIESAGEMTPEHRAEMLALVSSLEGEVEAGELEEGEGAEKLREAIAVTERAVRQRGDNETTEEHDLRERLSELENRVEMVAIEHPVIANVLAAIARLV